MKYKDVPMYKALYFDLNTKSLCKYYDKKRPQGGYEKIFEFMHKNSFVHEQGSGYHSKYPVTDIHVFNVVHIMQKTLPWFSSCVEKFEVANLAENYNLMKVITVPNTKLPQY